MRNWERRLREMVLAGGAVSAAACSTSSGSSFADASVRDSPDSSPPDGSDSSSGSGCCNVSPDPCCEVQYCDAAMTPACACQMEGGAWQYGTMTCSLPADAGGDGTPGASEGGTEAGEAGQDEAGTDSGGHD